MRSIFKTRKSKAHIVSKQRTPLYSSLAFHAGPVENSGEIFRYSEPEKPASALPGISGESILLCMHLPPIFSCYRAAAFRRDAPGMRLLFPPKCPEMRNATLRSWAACHCPRRKKLLLPPIIRRIPSGDPGRRLGNFTPHQFGGRLCLSGARPAIHEGGITRGWR